MLSYNTRSWVSGERIKQFFRVFVLALLIIFSGYFVSTSVFAGDAVLPSTILLSASASDSSAGITLTWNADAGAQKYDIYRKTKDSTSWGGILATVLGSATTYVDTTAGVGSVFEYRVVKTRTTGGTDEGYVLAGNKAPLVDSRGKVILVVDNTYAADLSFELNRLKDDLEGDGWIVARQDVNRTDTPTSIRSKIKLLYDIDPTNTSHVFLFGHVPVPYSGFAPYDGHEDHAGAWPADIFYGDIDGTWTDTETIANRYPVCEQDKQCKTISSRTANFPGDGKFDQMITPSKVELAVGRVDFVDMPAFLPKSEKDLLRQYLNKDHLFRIGGMNVRTDKASKGMTFDQWGFFHEQDTWKDFVTFFGQNGFLSDGNIFTTATNNPYLWLRVAGGGFPSGIGYPPQFSVSDIAQHGGQAVFNQMFGSYFGDFGYANNLMRGFIADKSYGLTSAWVGFLNWKFHRMGLGETIGDSTRLSQNIDSNQSYVAPYRWTGDNRAKRSAAMALIGDPTLRQNVVLPPTNVIFTGQSGSIKVSWTASTDTNILGYHVYKATPDSSAFVRLTTTPVTATNFTDSAVTSGRSRYMVKAVKLQTTGSGSYYNGSQGVSRLVSVLAFANPISVQDITVTGGGCALGACPTTGATRAVSDLVILPASPATITTKQGEVFSTTFHYRGGPTAKGWNPFTFLVSEDDMIVVGANDGGAGYPYLTFSQSPATWSGEDRFETFTFKTPTNNFPPGKYRLVTGFYDGPARFSLINETGKPNGWGSYDLAYQVAEVIVEAGVDTIAPGRGVISVNTTVPPAGSVTLPTGTTNATVSFVTDESATCKYSTVSETVYSAMTGVFVATNGGKNHSTLITGLTDGAYRNIYTRCRDMSGNVNTVDNWRGIRVEAPPVLPTSEVFTISATNNTTVTIERGSFGVVSIPIQRISGVARPVIIRLLSDLGTSMTYSFINPDTCTPNSVTSSCTFTLRINTTSDTALGTNIPVTFGFLDGATSSGLGLVTVLLNVVVPVTQILPTTIVPATATTPPPPVIVSVTYDTKDYQSITFDTIPNKMVADSFDLRTVARAITSNIPNNQPLTFAVLSGPASILNNIISFTGAGSVTVRASQAGNTNYYAAAPVERTFTVGKATGVINFDTTTLAQTYGGDMKTVTATNPLGKRVDLTYRQISRYIFGLIISVNEITTAPQDAGEYEVTATINDSQYMGTEVRTLIINKAPQVITTNFATLALQSNRFVGGTARISAISPASGAVTLSVSGGGGVDIVGDELTFTKEGTVRIVASHGQDNNYLPATDKEVVFTVAKSDATVRISGTTQVYTGASQRGVTVTTVPEGLPYTVTYAGSTIIPTEVGVYGPVVATVNTALRTGQATDSLTIVKADQVITFPPIANEKKVDELFDIEVTSTSPLLIQLSVTGPATLGTNSATGKRTLKITGVGLVEVTAAQAGGTNYNSAISKIQSFSTVKNTATINFDAATLTQIYDGNAKSATATTNPSGKSVNFSYRQVNSFFGLFDSVSNSLTAPVNAGRYEVTATIADGGYVGTAQVELVINRKTQTITTNFPTAPFDLNKYVNGSIELSALTSVSGELATFSVSDTSIAEISAASVVTKKKITFKKEGQVTVTAAYAGDKNYAPATSVSVIFTVSKTSASIWFNRLSFVYDTQSKDPDIATSPTGLARTISYADSATTHVNVGTYPFTATITDSAYTASANGTLQITKANQVITFADISSGKKVNDEFDLNITSTSPTPIQLSVTGPATLGTNSVTGKRTVKVTGTEPVAITAEQPTTPNYFAATSVTKTFTATKTAVNIGLIYPVNTVYNGESKVVTYTTDRVVPTGSVAVTYNGSPTVPVNAGTYIVSALITDVAFSGTANGTLTISKASQTFTFTPTALRNVGATETLSTSGSQGAVTFSVVGGTAGINQTTKVVTYSTPGQVKIRAAAAETSNYAPFFIERDITVSGLRIVDERTEVRVVSPRESHVKWGTNIQATSEVVYAPTADWAFVSRRQTKNISGNRMNHEIILLNLKPKTEYTYKVISKDADGNEAFNDPVFTTADEPHRVTTSTSGTGTGTVTLSLVGTSCGTNCQEFSYGTQVTITATPATGSIFTSFSGCTISGSNSCIVTLDQDHTVTATFALDTTGVVVPPPVNSFITSTVGTTDFSGWAWSSNVGWISFNGANSTAGGGAYKVVLDNATREFSGYAWSSTIGWITFNKNQLVGCPSGTCVAKLVGDSFSGWARACAGMSNSTSCNDTVVSTGTQTTTAGPSVWTKRTTAGQRNWFDITSSSDGTKLAAVELPGYVHTSTDGGATWTQRTGAGTHRWRSITSSADGTKLAAVHDDGAADGLGYVYTSTDSGATWTERTGAGRRAWYSVTSSADGTKLAATDYGNNAGGYIYTSTDSGATWTERTGAGRRVFLKITSSTDGTKLAVADRMNGYVYTSTDSGATWIERTNSGQRTWFSITSSADGTKLAAVALGPMPQVVGGVTVSVGGYIYTSTDSGATWTERTGAGQSVWYSIASSADGTKLVAGNYGYTGASTYNSYLYTSTDSGANWTQQLGTGQHTWNSITSSADGTKLAATDYESVYTYAPTVVTTVASTDQRGGFDGWISLDTKVGGGVSYGPKIVDNQLTGFAWGDKVLGWISFEWLDQLLRPIKPNVKIILSDVAVMAGQTTMITWEVENADTCVASGGWTGNKSKNGGTEQSGNITAGTTFFLNCKGPGGESGADASIGITTTQIPPSIEIEASPSTVLSGTNTTLSWRVNNATTCSASNNKGNTEWTGGADVPIDSLTTVSKIIHSLTQTTQFVLTCTKGGLSTTESVTVVVTNLPAAPSVSLTSPINNAQFREGETVTLIATASDTDGTITNVKFYDGATVIATDTSDPYEYSYVPSVGAHVFKARATDNSALPTDSATVSITVNALRNPTVTLTAPAPNSQYTVGTNISLSATASDTDGTISKVEFYDLSVSTTVPIGTDNAAPYTFTYVGPAVGTHQLKAKATDNDGLTGETGDVGVIVSAIALPPSVTLDVDPTTITSGQNTVLSWTVSDATSCVPSSNPLNAVWNGAGTKAIPATATSILTQTISLSTNTQFTLACTGPGGTSITNANVLVTSAPIAPNITLNVTIPNGLPYGLIGQRVLLSWTAFNADFGCTASGNWTGPKADSGLDEQSPVLSGSEATFTLTCSGRGGIRSQEATIEVRGGSRLVDPDVDPCGNGQACLKKGDEPILLTTEDVDLYVSSPTRVVTNYGRGFKGGLTTVNSNEAYTVAWETASSMEGSGSGWTCDATAIVSGTVNDFRVRDLAKPKGGDLIPEVASANWKSGTLTGIKTLNQGTSPIIKTYSVTCTKAAPAVTGLFNRLWQLASVGALAQGSLAPVTVSDSISVQVNPVGAEIVSNPVENGNCVYLNTVPSTTVLPGLANAQTFYRKNLVGPGESCTSEGQSFRCRAGEVLKGDPVSPYLDPNQTNFKAYMYKTCQESSVEEF